MGVEKPEGLSKPGAGKMLSALAERIHSDLASIRQVEYMIGLGVSPAEARTMTRAAAGTTLDRLTNKRAG